MRTFFAVRDLKICNANIGLAGVKKKTQTDPKEKYLLWGNVRHHGNCGPGMRETSCT